MEINRKFTLFDNKKHNILSVSNTLRQSSNLKISIFQLNLKNIEDMAKIMVNIRQCIT